ncbi:hypothetical protein Hanom_Chr08g00710591 [Helianthus anomalus]
MSQKLQNNYYIYINSHRHFAPVPSSILGFGHPRFPLLQVDTTSLQNKPAHHQDLPSPPSSLWSLTLPVDGGGIAAPVYTVRRDAHTPNTLLFPMTPPPPSFSLSCKLFSAGERRSGRCSGNGVAAMVNLTVVQ